MQRSRESAKKNNYMMVIPSLNCLNKECVHEKVRVSSSIGASWIHVDVTDGIFAPVILFGDVRGVSTIMAEEQFSAHIEVHLMVMDPEPYIRAWLASGAKRIIVHAESVRTVEVLKHFESMCTARGVEFGLAVKAETHNELIESFLDNVNFWTILAVPAGFSGGKFEEENALEKISFLKDRMPECVVEIDGGMNDVTGRRVKERGADIIISGAFIFGNADPQDAYNKLCNV